MRLRGYCHRIVALMIFAVSQSIIVEADGQTVKEDTHEPENMNGYVWPDDKNVIEKLAAWQDLKFGVLLHWGLYSVPGIVESWSICSEDVDWIRRKEMPYDEYKKWYWGLKDSLNPVNFDAGQWAEVMRDAGMKYMIFTSKHHDGFCMYDSEYTDFSIAHGAFRNDDRRDVARCVFDAFREKEFMIGCYFSKPDWHCQWYWSPYFATPNRHVNYNKARHPEWWENYRRFTRNQIGELMTRYGSMDILWLDGGWVSGDEIDLDSLLAKARERHPGLIAVDRSIRGKNENYQTPERGIPETQQNYPWESCIPLSDDWGWTPDARYKTAQTVINLLAETVAKGGCLLLGVGPRGDGVIEDEAAARLHEVGQWLRVNGDAIYETHTLTHFNEGNLWFTADKDGETIYAIYALPEGDSLPDTIKWTGNVPSGKVKLMKDKTNVKCTCEEGHVEVALPKGLKNEPLVLKFTIKNGKR